MPVWQDSVATVFDFSRQLLIVDVEGTRETARRQVQLPTEPTADWVSWLQQQGVQVLICGAISQPLAWQVTRAGIGLIPFVAGPVNDVVAAHLCGQLADPRFLLAGSAACGRRRWRHGQRCRRNQPQASRKGAQEHARW